MSSARRPAPPPLEANDQMVTAVIIAGWAIALIVLLAVRTDIPASDRWWIWTCVTGLGLGVFGLLYVPRLKRSRERAAQRRAAAGRGATEPGPALGVVERLEDGLVQRDARACRRGRTRARR